MTSVALTLILCARSATRDGLRHVHFLDHGLGRARWKLGRRRRRGRRAAPPRGARQPARACPPVSPRVFSARFLAASSAQLDDSFSDLTDFLSPGLAAPGAAGAPGRAAGLVDRALDAGRIGLDLGLGLFGLLGDQHLLRRAHHRADRRGLGLGRLAALGRDRPGAASPRRRSSAGLDHAHRRRLGRRLGGAGRRRGVGCRRAVGRAGGAAPAAALLGGGLRRAPRRPRARAAPALRARGASRPALLPGGAAARPGGDASSARRSQFVVVDHRRRRRDRLPRHRRARRRA